MSARDDNPRLHRIVVERDADGAVESVRFVCDGDDAAPCHHWPACGCEIWGGDHGQLEIPGVQEAIPPAPGHEDVQQRECWMSPWFNDAVGSPLEFAELYEGDEDYEADAGLEWLVSGHVQTTFQGDYMTWEYAS